MALADWLARWKGMKVVIIGDLILDCYVSGRVARISPEAPVPVVEAHTHKACLGGAANVARNIAALGAIPILCGVIGKDEAAKRLMRLVQEQKMTTKGLIQDPTRPTTTKTRIMSGEHCLLRIDEEVTHWIEQQATEALLARFEDVIAQADVVLFEDYDKGTLTPNVIAACIATAHSKGIPIGADPKHRQFHCYQSITLLKPNLAELYQVLGRPVPATIDAQALTNDVSELQKALKVDTFVVTLSEHGLFGRDHTGKTHYLRAHLRQIADVSGAGDAVFSVLGLGLLGQIPLAVLLEMANLAGGIVCESPTVTPIQLDTLRAAALNSPWIQEQLAKRA